MKHRPINGWTRAAMIARVMERVPESGCRVAPGGVCLYRDANGGACAVGAFMDDALAAAVDRVRADSSIVGLIDSGRVDVIRDRMPLPVDGLRELQQSHDWPKSGRTARASVIAWVESNVEPDAAPADGGAQ